MIRPGQAKGPSLQGAGGTPVNPPHSPTWFKFSVTHLDFQIGALTNDIELYSMPAESVLHGAILKPSTTFLGGAISSYKLSLGLTGDLQRYMNLADVFTGPVAGDYFYDSSFMEARSFTVATSIRIAAQSIGANLSASTQGAADIWLLISDLP